MPLVLLDSLLFVVSPMLERIMRRAVERAYALRSLTLLLQLEKAPSYERHIRPAIATQSRDLLLKLLKLDLQSHPPQAAILGMTLTAEAARPQTAQRGLFQAQFPEPDKLDILLARLRSIAGDHNVGAPELRNSHRAPRPLHTLSPNPSSRRAIMQNSSEFQYVAIDTIHESTTNPRRTFDEPKLQELADYVSGHISGIMFRKRLCGRCGGKPHGWWRCAF